MDNQTHKNSTCKANCTDTFHDHPGTEVSLFRIVYSLSKKRPGSRRNAKINVALRDAQTIESPSYWPYGISCLPWLSNRQWEEKIAQDQPEDYGSSENSDHDELDNYNADLSYV
uniref:Uncharacterized protein n=1 Tax=Magallana gigas TaxID=29159 RepID=A0A8W8IKW6_MAGGI